MQGDEHSGSLHIKVRYMCVISLHVTWRVSPEYYQVMQLTPLDSPRDFMLLIFHPYEDSDFSPRLAPVLTVQYRKLENLYMCVNGKGFTKARRSTSLKQRMIFLSSFLFIFFLEEGGKMGKNLLLGQGWRLCNTKQQSLTVIIYRAPALRINKQFTF